MSTPGYFSGTDLTSPRQLDCDFCVVGSGAGGAMAAAILAQAGAKVVVVEEGKHHTRRDFNMQEAWAYPALYQDHGNRATDDLSVLLLQGRSVGGGTTINWGSSFRIPESTLELWRTKHGLENLSTEILRPHYEAVEQRLNVQEGRLDDVNKNNAKLFAGAAALGFKPQLIRRSVKGCARLGFCGMGCPLDAKQSSLVTYIPDAIAAGAALYSDCKVVALGSNNAGIVNEVIAQSVRQGSSQDQSHTLRVRARRGVILSAGAINTPALLMRSNLSRMSQRIGERTFLHPTIPLVGMFEEPIEGFYGPPQSVACHHFSKRSDNQVGYFLEAAPVHPMLAAVAFPGFGNEHRALAGKLSHAQATIALMIDGHGRDVGGTVSVSAANRIKLHYPFANSLLQAGTHAIETMAKVLFAAGAEKVVTLHREPLILKSEAELPRLRERVFGPQLHTMFSAHQMGGCAMGNDAGNGVTKPDGHLRGHENVWVMDGSLFPTSLGVNPQLTIYALVRHLIEQLLLNAR
jgi:choline dehydrogenase-like flavoprotein